MVSAGGFPGFILGTEQPPEGSELGLTTALSRAGGEASPCSGEDKTPPEIGSLLLRLAGWQPRHESVI